MCGVVYCAAVYCGLVLTVIYAKTHLSADGWVLVYVLLDFLERVDVESYAAFEVSRFVLVDNVAFSELIEHSGYLGEKLFCRLFVGGVAKSSHRITGGLVIIFVAKPLYVGLTDSLFR